MSPHDPSTERFGAVLAALHEELDWDVLGDLYCHEGGEEFFPPAQREAILDAGLRLTGDLGRELERLPRDGPRRSLYFGAALAELPPILYEALVAGRAPVWRNLEGAESLELNRALDAVSSRLGLALPRVETAASVPRGPFDHLWCASVFTDPDHYPALHDELYRRSGTDLAVGGGDRRRERHRASDLARGLVAELVVPGVLVTSDEEVPVFQEAARELGRGLSVPAEGRTSPIVGDVLRLCALVAGPAPDPHRPARRSC